VTAQKPLVVVVDDDPGMSRALARMIEAGGMTPVIHGSAESMLAAGHRAAACIVIDVQLPGMDGFQLYETLAARGNRTPIVFISASEEAEAQAREIHDPLVTFLAKPLSGLTLLETLQALVDKAA